MKRDYANYQVALKVLLRRGDEVLFLRITDPLMCFDLPGGRIDNVETKTPLARILAREVREELGVDVRYTLGAPLFQFRRYVASHKIYNFLIRVKKFENGNLEVVPVGRRKNTRSGSVSYGVADYKYVRHDIRLGKKLRSLGIRTYRPLAMIGLEEIIDENGNPITIDAAKEKGILSPDEKPVLELRAYGTKERIDDVMSPNDHIVEDAKLLVSQELGVKIGELTTMRYLFWFAETLGKNVGLLHAHHYSHNYLSPHNITLDARIVDLDSVVSFARASEEEKMEVKNDDYNDARISLETLMGWTSGGDGNKDVHSLEDRSQILETFKTHYREALHSRSQ